MDYPRIRAAEFIVDFTKELAALAEANGLKDVACILRIAEFEARNALPSARPKEATQVKTDAFGRPNGKLG
jgi:hypothetical protein